MNLSEKSLRALEYDKVLALLSEECSCEDSAQATAALRPCPDIFSAREALAQSEDASRLCLKFGGPSFYGLKNIDSPLNKAKKGSSLSTRELLNIAGVLYTFRSLNQYRAESESASTCLDELFDSIYPNKYLEDRINTAIPSEDEIADTASAELADIRRGIKRAEARVREQLDKMIRSAAYQKYLQDPIVTIRSGRFVVPVKSEHRADVPGLVHDSSASGATFFIEPIAVVEANNQLKVLRDKEEKEKERILADLSAEVGNFADSIGSSVKTAVFLDFIFAKARLSFKMKACAPKLETNGMIELKAARHPLIPAEKVVAVDIILGEKYDTLVVTGPNTGGKTVSLKTLGLITLMAASGLMVPVSPSSRVAFFEQVLAEIGDEQSIEQSLSTFSAHMTGIIDILKECGPNSLILLDELGSGTDPVEGAALAIAILESLKEKGTKTAATTHYPELKEYALQTERVENASCEFDISTLRPTYRLLIGAPGRSNAFAISHRLGLSEEIIGRAKELVSSDKTRFEDIIQNLEIQRQEMEKERETAAALRIKAEKEKSEAENVRRELDAFREREMEKARVAARNLLERSRSESQALLDELDDLRRMKDKEDLSELKALAKSQIHSRLKAIEDRADPIHKKETGVYRLPRELKPGDTVLITDIDKKGTVLDKADASGYVEVQAGIIKTRVRLESLRLLQEKTRAAAAYTPRTGPSRASVQVKTELDLRGMTVDEALLELDRFIDNALLAGIGQISVIHGKGTGALRSAVQQFLKTHRSVTSYRLGRYGEGENGVTIVEIN